MFLEWLFSTTILGLRILLTVRILLNVNPGLQRDICAEVDMLSKILIN